MKPIQKCISYLSRIVVEKKSSLHNEKLIVAIQDGKYVLNAKNANYSFASLHRVFQKALARINLSEKQVNQVLVLGCGAGSIPEIIYEELRLNPKMDAVEIDPEVIALGKKYFKLDEYSQLNIIVADAMDYVKQTNKTYDLILVDVFNGLDVPKAFLAQHFLEQVKSLLNDKGELLLNFVAYNYDTKEQVKQIESKMEKVFGQAETIRIENINRVFHCRK